MSSIQIDKTQTTGVKTNYELEKLTPISIPEDFDDDASNNAKKSRKYLFSKVEAQSPKIESKYEVNQMTNNELAALYKSLSSKEQKELIKEIFESNPGRLNDIYQNLSSSEKNQFVMQELKTLSSNFTEMINNAPPDVKDQFTQEFLTQMKSISNSLPKDQRDEYISKFKKSLDKAIDNDKDLTTSQKKESKSEASQICKLLKGDIQYKDLKKGSGILNIFMIMVKSWCSDMNTESMDMIAQINQISLDNKFMSLAQGALAKISNKLAGLGDVKKRGWVFAVVSAVVVIGIFVFSCLTLEPETVDVDMSAKPNPEDVPEPSIEPANNGADGAVPEEKALNGEMEMEDLSGPESSASSPIKQTENLEQEVVQPENDPDNNNTTSQATQSTKEQDTRNAQQQKAIKKKQNKQAENKQGINNNEIKNKKKVIWDYKNKKLKAFKNTIAFGGFAAISLWGFLKGIDPKFVTFKKGTKQQPDSTDLTKDQNDSLIETTVTDTLNNSIQTSSKFIDNDSQKQNQYSGDVQQAINMFGQIFTGGQ